MYECRILLQNIMHFRDRGVRTLRPLSVYATGYNIYAVTVCFSFDLRQSWTWRWWLLVVSVP